MAKNSLFEVEGIKELNEKLKKLPDKVKRKEVLGLQRKIAAPIRAEYADKLPHRTGNLGKSVAVQTVPASKTGGNPSVVVRPAKRGKADGYYKFMVIPKGSKPGSRRRGSRKTLNTVVKEARDRTVAAMNAGITKTYETAMAKLIQRKIDRL